MKKIIIALVFVFAVVGLSLALTAAVVSTQPAPASCSITPANTPAMIRASLTEDTTDVVGSWVSDDTTHHVRQTIILNGDNTARLVIEYTDNARNTDFLKGWWKVEAGVLVVYDTRAAVKYPVSRTGDVLTIGVRTWTKVGA